jgi:malate/lactate dehydrogenase
MVFKVNNYLNSIFTVLGNPADNYYYIVRQHRGAQGSNLIGKICI